MTPLIYDHSAAVYFTIKRRLVKKLLVQVCLLSLSNHVNDYIDLVLICVLLKFMCALSAPLLTFGSYNLEFTQENDLL